MRPQEVFEAARARARVLGARSGSPVPPLADALERDCAAWWASLPEPPLYRRVDDPAVAQARVKLEEGRELLARAWALGEAGRVPRLAEIVGAHVEALCHAIAGQLPDAERAWERAREQERALRRETALWSFGEEDAAQKRPVFDRSTQSSRYDPRPEPELTVKLFCPHRGCGAEQRYRLTRDSASHQFTCPTCRRPFVGHFGEVRRVERQAAGQLFVLDEAPGGTAQVWVDVRGSEVAVNPRDFVAFLYDGQGAPSRQRMLGVLNLSTGRILLFHRSGVCFVATAVYGETAPELAAFRAFRDEVLLPTRAGRLAVRAYWFLGPRAARVVQSSSIARSVARAGLDGVHRQLVRKGFS